MRTITTTAVGERLARALAAKDRTGLVGLFADLVDFQALTPGRHWQTTSPGVAVDDFILGVWFGPGDTIEELRSVTCGQVADRERVTYRLAVRRAGRRYVVEQHAYFNSDGERIDWIRLLCSGYRLDVREV
ncbi:MAG TPA: hypothetical protein VIC62_24750 [Nakamurella sp.]|jgi:hypothetical protein